MVTQPDEVDHQPEDGLEFMPRVVRDKLDRIGIKVHLSEWQTLALADRRRLRDSPCTTPEEVARYAEDLERVVIGAVGHLPERLQPGRKP